MTPRAATFTAVDREAFLARLWEMDEALVAAGFPPMSPWWRQQIARFVRSGCRRWPIRAGRRAGKSTTLCRLAVAWAWFGPWSVPPGDVAVIPFVSVSRDEASARLRTIAAILRELGLRLAERADELELRCERPVLFKTLSCTVRGVVGFTSVAVFGDEVAKWESRDTMANPAREVVGSLAPTMATQPHAFMVLCSSPWGTDDYHAELVDQGDTEHQVVSDAPTWEANPTITEEQTRALEPDERVWQREYAAIPGATVTAALDKADVLACFARELPDGLTRPWLAIDASSLRGDAFAWAVGRSTRGGELVVSEVGGFEGEELRGLTMATVVERVADVAQRFGVHKVFGDQREAASLESMFAEHRLAFTSYAWSEPSKDEAMQLLRRLMRELRLYLPPHRRLSAELTGMKARLQPSGRIRYETNGLDYASALVTLMHAVVAGDYQLGAVLTVFAVPGGGDEPPLRDGDPRWGGTRWAGMPGRGFG